MEETTSLFSWKKERKAKVKGRRGRIPVCTPTWTSDPLSLTFLVLSLHSSLPSVTIFANCKEMESTMREGVMNLLQGKDLIHCRLYTVNSLRSGIPRSANAFGVNSCNEHKLYAHIFLGKRCVLASWEKKQWSPTYYANFCTQRHIVSLSV